MALKFFADHCVPHSVIQVLRDAGHEVCILNGYSAYVPDLPGCVAAADTKPEVEDLLREAIVLHLESLREHGEPIPQPQTTAALIEVQPL